MQRKKKRQKRKAGYNSRKKMKYIWTGIAAGVVLAAVLLLVIFWKPANEAASGKSVVNKPQENTDVSGKSGEEDTAADWYSLPGYKNGVDKDEEQIICGVSLPYQVQDTPVVIEGIGQYTGPFVEDGSDEPVANVLAIVVKNDSDTDIEYAEVKFAAEDGSEADFHISTLPAGKSAVVLEQNKREYSADETFTFAEKLYAAAEEMALMEEEAEVTAKDGVLTLKNLTKEPFETIYVRYKNKLNEDYYLGGITYSCKFENVGAGKSAEAQTKHFTADGSTVLMVKAIEE